MSLRPGIARLKAGLRSTLRELESRCDGNAEAQQSLRCAHAFLDELTLRDDVAYYQDYVARGRALLQAIPAPALAGFDAGLRGIAAAELAATDATDIETLGDNIERLRRCFEVFATYAATSPDAADLAAAVLRWEAERYARSAAFNAPAQQRRADPLTAEALQAYLRRKFPQRDDLRVTAFQPLVGGTNKLTILFETHDRAQGAQSLALRGEHPDKHMLLDLGTVAEEYRVVELAHRAGLPVAEPLWVETDASLLGRRFMVSRKISGTNYGAFIGGGKTLPPSVGKSFMATLAQVHALPLEQHAEGIEHSKLGRWLAYRDMAENTRENVRYWREMLELRPHSASPTLALTYAWLMQHAPQTAAPICFLHGDFAPHNVLVDGDRVSGVLDWEIARIGDPAEDLAWFLHTTAAQIERAQAIRWYEEAGGARISEFRLRYFELMTVFKTLVGCLAMEALYETEADARNACGWIALKWTHDPHSHVLEKLAAAQAALHAHQGEN